MISTIQEGDCLSIDITVLEGYITLFALILNIMIDTSCGDEDRIDKRSILLWQE
jgi:hypothetical protein